MAAVPANSTILGSTIVFAPHSLEQALEGLAAAGYRNCEIGAVKGWFEHIDPDTATDAEINFARQKLDDLGLAPVSMSGNTQLQTAEGKERFRRAIDIAHALGMQIVTGHNIRAVDGEGAQLVCVYSGREQRISCASIVAVTARLPHDSLQKALEALSADWAAAGIEAVTPIGDCHAPGLIAHAVYAGHRYARELDEPVEGEVCFRRRASQPPMT